MAPDDTAQDQHSTANSEPVPELADWWVWAMRKIAGMFAEWLMISRGLIVFFILLKLGYWAVTRDTQELYHAGAGVVGLAGVWGIAHLLGRFAWQRESPDPDRWLAQRWQK